MPLPARRSHLPDRGPRRRTRSRLALGLLIALSHARAYADWDVDASVGAFYDDNLTRAANAADKRAAGAATVNANATDFAALTGSDGITYTLYARAELFDRYSGLANLTLGGVAVYRYKFGVGNLASWAAFSAGASYDDFREDLRTGSRLDVRAETGTRFSEQLDASMGVYYERGYDTHGQPVVPGISGRVFDLRGQGAFVRAGYAATNDLYLDARAGVRRGDVESTSQQSLPIFLASSAIAADPVWGDPNLYAYRLRGTTWCGDLTASYALSGRSSLELEYRYAFTRAAEGLEYTTNTILLTFDYRF